MQFTKKLNVMACVSAVIILAGIVAGIFNGGMNVGVDFTGGSIVSVEFTQADFDMDIVEAAVEKEGVNGAQLVRTGNTTSYQNIVNIRMPSEGSDEKDVATRLAVLANIQQTYPEANIISVDRVDGVASATLVRNALLAVLIASVLILLYIWMRFELRSGVAAVTCLLHDVLIMMSVTTILRIPVNSPFIAAVLTIVGYSINNTIVVFDRVRENTKNVSQTELDKNRDEIVDRSIKDTLTRSINTSLTTLITIGMVYILGVESIREFSLPIIVGLLAGTYSSIFLAAPFWAKWHSIRLEKSKQGATGKKSAAKKSGK